jgi:hypothetical protein
VVKAYNLGKQEDHEAKISERHYLKTKIKAKWQGA